MVIAARTSLAQGTIEAPHFTPSTRSNFPHVRLPVYNLDVVGMRVPMFDGHPGASRKYWVWFETEAGTWINSRMVLLGDLNANPTEGQRIGESHLTRLAQSGWQISNPSEPWSYAASGSRLDHALVSPSLILGASSFVAEIDGPVLADPQRPSLSDHAALVVEVDGGGLAIPSE